MKFTHRIIGHALLSALLLLCGAADLRAQVTTFTYQGRLNESNNPANGSYDITFALYSVSNGGGVVAGPITNTLAVSNGLFTAALDFGPSAFTGPDRWLEFGVRPSGLGDFVLLNARQWLTPTPYAIMANTAGNLLGTLAEWQLPANVIFSPTNDVPGVIVRQTTADSPISDVFAVQDRSGTTNYFRVDSNGNVSLSGHTVIQGDLEAARLNIGTGHSLSGDWIAIAGGISNTIGYYYFGQQAADYSTVGGGSNNTVIDSSQATIAGGGNNQVYSTSGGGRADFAFIGGGSGNVIEDSRRSSIVGGSGNHIHSFVIPATVSAFIGGGEGNTIQAGGSYSAIGGGASNLVTARYCTIGGGRGNVVSISSGSGSAGRSATIAGGEGNRITGCGGGTIGGGLLNTNSGWAGTIAGGSGNSIGGDCDFGGGDSNASIGGGSDNFIASFANYSTIAGGLNNRIGLSTYPNFNWGAAVGGGSGNSIQASYGTVPGGVQAKVSNYGQMAYATGQFADTGDAQTSVYVCRSITTNTTQTELFLDGDSARMTVPTNSTWCFDIIVTGRASDGTSAAYHILGEIKNNNGSTTFGSAITKTVLAEDVGSWDATAAPDGTNNALAVKVTGAGGASIRWVASVRTVEVSY